jgi:hypothetical protein
LVAVLKAEAVGVGGGGSGAIETGWLAGTMLMMANLQYIGQVKDRSVEVDHGDCPTLLASTPHRAGTAVAS